MAKAAEFGLMIWDSKSTGTLSNVIELLSCGRKSVVFVNKDKVFRNVGSVEQLSDLTGRMSEPAFKAADEKIKLSARIESLRARQQPMFD